MNRIEQQRQRSRPRGIGDDEQHPLASEVLRGKFRKPVAHLRIGQNRKSFSHGASQRENQDDEIGAGL